MAHYVPESVPKEYEELRAYIERELYRVGDSMHGETEAVFLVELHVEPDKPRDGQVIFADGTDWNPGSGAGYYGYRAAAWRFLG